MDSTKVNTTQSTDLLITWRTTLAEAAQKKDLATLLAGEVAMLRLTDELRLLVSEVETAVARTAITALIGDITLLTSDIAEAVNKLGRPVWPKRRGGEAMECLDRAVDALDDAKTAIIQEAVREAMENILRGCPDQEAGL